MDYYTLPPFFRSWASHLSLQWFISRRPSILPFSLSHSTPPPHTFPRDPYISLPPQHLLEYKVEGEGAAALKTAAGRRQAAAAGLEGPPPARTVSEYLGGKVKLLSFLFDHFRVKHVWEDDSNSNNNCGDPGFESIVGKGTGKGTGTGRGGAKKKSGRVSRHSGDSMTRQQFTLMYVEESEEIQIDGNPTLNPCA